MTSHLNESQPKPLTEREAVARGAVAAAGARTSALTAAETTDSTTGSDAAEDTAVRAEDTSITGDAERADDGTEGTAERLPAAASGTAGSEVDGDWSFTPWPFTPWSFTPWSLTPWRDGIRGVTAAPPLRRFDGAESPPEASASEASEGLVRPGRRVGAPARVEEPIEAEPSDGEPEPDEPAEPVVSANAIGIAANPEPTPRATASAPTRPT